MNVFIAAAAALSALLLTAAVTASAAIPSGGGPLFSSREISQVRWLPDSSGIVVTTASGTALVNASGTFDILASEGTLSPDGFSLLFSDPADENNIKIKFIKTGVVQPLGIIGTGPKWSPDGGKIAFYSAPKGCGSPAAPPADAKAKCPPAEITTADFHTNTVTPILGGFDPGDAFEWTADSAGLIYYRDGELGACELSPNSNSVVDSNQPFPPVGGMAYTPSIAVTRAAAGVPADSSATAAAFLFRKNDSKTPGAWNVNDDVRMVVFDTRTLKPMHRDERAWFLDSREAAAGYSLKGISLSPDGHAVAYSGRDQSGFFIRMAPIAGPGAPITYRFPDSVPLLPEWSPDGAFLAYVLVSRDPAAPAGQDTVSRLFISPVSSAKKTAR